MFCSRMNLVTLTEAEIDTINTDCENALNQVLWYTNADLSNCSSIRQAIQLARDGLDGGPTAIEKFKPNNGNFTAWMNYAHLITVYYNRDKRVKKYTILRTRIQDSHLQNKNSICGL